MRKSSRLRLRATGALCLLFGLCAQSIQAQALGETASTSTGADSPWILGLTTFYKVSPEVLAETASPEFSLEKASGLASTSEGGALSVTLPSLLFSALDPLPHRLSAETAVADTPKTSPSRDAPASAGDKAASSEKAPQASQKPRLIPASLQKRATGSPFADAEKGKEAFAGLNGLLVGFYSFQGETLECGIFFFEKDTEKPLGSVLYKGSIASLENIGGETLPAILRWVANRDLGCVDIIARPAAGATFTVEGEIPEGDIAVDGARVFVYGKGGYSIAIKQKGYEDGSLAIAAIAPGSYRSVVLEMRPSATAPASTPEESIIDAADRLKWKEETGFLAAEKKFSSSLGRFVMSLPIAAIAVGTFYSFYEAYSRGAASDTALYASGAAAAVSISLSAGFIIDSAIKLIDVLHASR
ncbi:MAG TPA: hypothetical protein VN445_03865 [Rectinemataceae bacterium]|nr:hypothetical protein [Rectinemataceae bacterium]